MSEKMVKYKYRKPTKPIILDDSKTKPPYQAVEREEKESKFCWEDGDLKIVYNPNMPERNNDKGSQ